MLNNKKIRIPRCHFGLWSHRCYHIPKFRQLDGRNKKVLIILRNLKKNLNSNSDEKICRILIGNKCDLDAKRQVESAVAKDFADQHGMKYYESSAKTGNNVEQRSRKCAASFSPLKCRDR